MKTKTNGSASNRLSARERQALKLVAVTKALRGLHEAKRSGDFALAIAIGEVTLALYLFATPPLGRAQEYAGRALELLTSLEAKYPGHDRVAAARNIYRKWVTPA